MILRGAWGQLQPWQRDPTLLVLAFALWSLLSGVSLLWPGDVFRAAVSYHALLRLGIPEESWGIAMLGDAAALGGSALGGPRWARAAVALLSGSGWLYFGLHVVAGAFGAGVFSVIGWWEVAMGAGLLGAAVQWVGYNAVPALPLGEGNHE